MNHRLFASIASLCLCFAVSVSHAAPQEKEWNFLVFMNGVNSLDSFTSSNLKQMEAVGSNDKMNILVQWGSASDANTKRMLIQKSKDPNNVTSPVLQNMGNVDMGDYREIVKFVQWAHDNFPAKKYFVVVWDHGGGWHLPAPMGLHPHDISWDDRTGHFVTTEQLGQALADSAKVIGHKIDVYGSDACLMGMVEVASQVADSVNYYVGSQEVEPGDGWPYTPFLTKWNNQLETLGAKDVATLLAQEYKAAYSPGGVFNPQGVTMAAYDLSHLGDFEASLKVLGDSLIRLPNGQMDRILSSANNTKYFTESDYRDVIDFMDQLTQTGITNPAMAGVRKAQSAFVLSNDQNVDSNSWGVSIWVPTDASDYDTYSARYQNLNFNRNTGWMQFLKALLKK